MTFRGGWLRAAGKRKSIGGVAKVTSVESPTRTPSGDI
jgi:hypothetical protein